MFCESQMAAKHLKKIIPLLTHQKMSALQTIPLQTYCAHPIPDYTCSKRLN